MQAISVNETLDRRRMARIWGSARRTEPLNKQSGGRAPLPRLGHFPGRATHTIRSGDIDAQRHVNNTVFAVFFESGRVQVIRDPEHGLRVPGATLVLARTEIDYLRELHYPGTVEIGTGIAGIGRSSLTFGQAIFTEGACAATGRAVMVLIDATTRRSRPLPEDLIGRMRQWLVQGE
jgi:acyl-CoA thioester hydrolase